MHHRRLPICPSPHPHYFPSSSSMSPPTSLLPCQVETESFNEVFLAIDNQDLNNKYNQFIQEFLVDELLDLKGLPEPEKKVDETEQDTKEASFIPFEKNEALLLSEISVPEETESAYLEWLSRFVHDCHLPQLPATEPPAFKAPALIAVKGKRSKRRRRATAPWSLFVPLLLRDTSPVHSHTSFSSSSSFYQWQHQNLKNGKPEELNQIMPQKRGRRPKNLCGGNGAGGERRCTHCGVQKTPQWRAGPGGPKTLCNACGVRFKSGRLLPEYRPACSPTFISKIHSNSHRKVLEMRQKKVEQLFTASAPAVHSC